MRVEIFEGEVGIVLTKHEFDMVQMSVEVAALALVTYPDLASDCGVSKREVKQVGAFHDVVDIFDVYDEAIAPATKGKPKRLAAPKGGRLNLDGTPDKRSTKYSGEHEAAVPGETSIEKKRRYQRNNYRKHHVKINATNKARRDSGYVPKKRVPMTKEEKLAKKRDANHRARGTGPYANGATPKEDRNDIVADAKRHALANAVKRRDARAKVDEAVAAGTHGSAGRSAALTVAHDKQEANDVETITQAEKVMAADFASTEKQAADDQQLNGTPELSP